MRKTKPVLLEERIFAVRGQRVMADRDLAELYGIETKALNQAYQRNRERFPEGFAFRLSEEEQSGLISACERLRPLLHARQPSLVFTDYGVAMLSSILRSARAVRVKVQIIRTFVRLRRLVLMDRDLREAVTALQFKVGEHDESIQKVLEALGRLMQEAPKKIPVVGFQRREEI